jgi:hypothetical protein
MIFKSRRKNPFESAMPASVFNPMIDESEVFQGKIFKLKIYPHIDIKKL